MKNAFILILLFAAGCATVKTTTTSDQTPEYQKVAFSLLGEDLTYTMNEPQSYVLCVKEMPGTSQQPRNSISFVVIDLSNNQMVIKQKLTGGTVGWYSDYEIEVFQTPGMVRHDQSKDDFTTIYNVTKGTSYPKKGKQTK